MYLGNGSCESNGYLSGSTWLCVELLNADGDTRYIYPHGFLQERIGATSSSQQTLSNQVLTGPAGRTVELSEPTRLRRLHFLVSPDGTFRNCQTGDRLDFRLTNEDAWLMTPASQLRQKLHCRIPQEQSFVRFIEPLIITDAVVSRYQKSLLNELMQIVTPSTTAVFVTRLLDGLEWCLEQVESGNVSDYEDWLQLLELKTPVQHKLTVVLIEASSANCHLWSSTLKNCLHRFQPSHYAYTIRLCKRAFGLSPLYARGLLVCLTKISGAEAKHFEWRVFDRKTK
eukprot:Gregarina_sp_Poly_1__305@NODE_1075_length_5172_cov_40_719491_g538_i1_p2_GENE_NODE_1075_length_5172_cov_40_719491_g538_i1NODE_1075_length_5172_cov_40_719491_g538_i1_p2_ORF_typecomplete_len284_score25_82Rz1/PF06085_11/0_97Rz1/PF06085_11/1_4e03_NODE_1075_length_5172_cov_40_719491_g538_i117582609